MSKYSPLESLDYVLNNGERYTVTISDYFKEKDYIVYQALIFDTAFACNYHLYFRFKTLKKLHEQMTKRDSDLLIPDFPKTRSYIFWNRTNQDPKLIQDRIRELEYYLTKILNKGELQNVVEVQSLRRSIRKNVERRTSS